MLLRDYIHSYPKGLRMKAREILANEIGVSPSTVKSWENGTRKISDRNLTLIESITGKRLHRGIAT